jgi:hypothetical protein
VCRYVKNEAVGQNGFIDSATRAASAVAFFCDDDKSWYCLQETIDMGAARFEYIVAFIHVLAYFYGLK